MNKNVYWFFLRIFLIFIQSMIICSLAFSGQEPAEKKPQKKLIDRHQPYNFIGKKGMVVAAHPLAAEAGLKILKSGGNAVDAAIATAFALNVTEPFASGIGGGGFMVIYLAQTDSIKVINYREKAPSLASSDMFFENGKINRELKRTHGLAVAVPGALAGWNLALTKYGTLKLTQVIQPAIKLADEGIIISETFSKINKDEYEKLLLLAGETTCYLNDGLPYEPGDQLKNPDLAETLRLIASKGIGVFYKGEIAPRIVEAVKNKGGKMTLDDLSNYRAIEQSPLLGTYKDFRLYTIAPPGSGGLHIIQLLNMLEKWPVAKWGHNSSAYIHHFSEALRYVFADRERYLGDPEFTAIPIENLTSKKYAAKITKNIHPDIVSDNYPYTDFDQEQNNKDNTTHLCVVDEQGNIVSLTQSINHFFGSGIIPEKSGFILNNHMDDFANKIDSPNSPGPNRRPVSSMGPLIMFKNKTPYLVLGSPGGTRIFPSLTQIIINIVEFNMSLDEAIEAPRFYTYSSNGKAQQLSMESRISPQVILSLEKFGHTIKIREAYDRYFGGAQGIMILRDKNIIHGGADSRRDGAGAGH